MRVSCHKSEDILLSIAKTVRQVAEIGSLNENEAAIVAASHNWSVDRSIAAVCNNRHQALEKVKRTGALIDSRFHPLDRRVEAY